MRAYVTSIGEPTTGICVDQLKRYGFDVILLDSKEPWIRKYRRFICEAVGPCLRIDADVVPNSQISVFVHAALARVASPMIGV